MGATHGRNWKLYIDDGQGNWLTFAGVREKSKSHSVGQVDHSAGEKDGYQHLLGGGRKSVSMNLSGLAKGGAALERVLEAVDSTEPVRMKAVGSRDVVTGYFHIGNWDEGASYQDAVTFSATFSSSGAYTWQRPITLIDAEREFLA